MEFEHSTIHNGLFLLSFHFISIGNEYRFRKQSLNKGERNKFANIARTTSTHPHVLVSDLPQIDLEAAGAINRFTYALYGLPILTVLCENLSINFHFWNFN